MCLFTLANSIIEKELQGAEKKVSELKKEVAAKKKADSQRLTDEIRLLKNIKKLIADFNKLPKKEQVKYNPSRRIREMCLNHEGIYHE